MPRPKGLPRTGGRKKGVPNKKTAEARAHAAEFLDSVNRRELRQLFDRAKETDAPGALRVYWNALEYVMPRLSRVEQTGPDGKAPVVEVRHVQMVFGEKPPAKDD